MRDVRQQLWHGSNLFKTPYNGTSAHTGAIHFSCLATISYFAPMIAYLKGTFTRKTPAAVVVDVGGVGYDVQISLNTYSKIQNLENGILQTYLLVREDAHILYGFFDDAEKGLFQNLISVSGIGAGTARVMLSYLKPDEISRAI